MGRPPKFRKIILASSDTYLAQEEYEDMKSIIAEEKEMNDEDTTVTPEEVYERMRMQNEDDLDNLQWELKRKQAAGQIIAIVDMGLWNGRKNGYKLLERNVEDIIDLIADYDNYEIYRDTDGNVKMTLSHHDGTHYVLFREFKPHITDSQMNDFISTLLRGELNNYIIGRYTKSINEYVQGITG